MVNPALIESLKVIKSPLIFFGLIIVMFTIMLTTSPILIEDQPYGFAFAIGVLLIMVMIIATVAFILIKKPAILTETEEGRIAFAELEQRYGELKQEIEEIKGKEGEDWYYALKLLVKGENPNFQERYDGNSIAIGAKEFPESQITSEIIVQLLKNKSNLTIKQKSSLGGSLSNFLALKFGYVDLYIDYTGTGMTYFFNEKGDKDIQKDYKSLNTFFNTKGIEWLKPLGEKYYNNYEIFMLTKKSQRKKIVTLKDLKKQSSQLVIGGTSEFIKRDDGLGILTRKTEYDMNFKKVVTLSTTERNVRSKMLKEGKIDVIEAQTTDIDLHDTPEFTKLQDTENKSSWFYSIPVIRSDVPSEIKLKIIEILDDVRSKITIHEIRDLIKEMTFTESSRSKIVEKFLKNKNLI